MAIREDLVASAANFLRDPSVASSPLDSRIAFLQAKNLTPEEIDGALARTGPEVGPAQAAPYPPSQSLASRPPAPPYYGQPYPPYVWQQQPPPAPRRDWRDWFIMATVVSGLGYGTYSLTKRYIYPLVAPPTPERLETDKKAIDDQFEKAFVLVEQLAKDTEALKAAEKERTEKLDNALLELETVISELKTANRRREDDTERIRTEVKDLKDSIPKALDAQKDMTSKRLKDVSAELTSLKSLISQRMNAGSAAPSAASNAGSYLRPSSGNAAPTTPSAPSVAGSASGDENSGPVPDANRISNGTAASSSQDSASGTRPSFGFGNGVKIPAWQLANTAKSPPSNVNGTESTPLTDAASSS